MGLGVLDCINSGTGKKERAMTVAISFGKYGGFYFSRGYTTRLCIGWVAITYFPRDIDTIFDKMFAEDKKPEARSARPLTQANIDHWWDI